MNKTGVLDGTNAEEQQTRDTFCGFVRDSVRGTRDLKLRMYIAY